MLTVAGPGTEYELRSPHLLPVAANPEVMLAAAELLFAKAATAAETESLRSQSTAAFMLLTIGDYERAARVLEQCVARQLALEDKQGCFRSQVRRVQVLQAQGHLLAAVRTAQAVATEAATCPELRQLEHFALHHLGKALLQAGRPIEAVAALTEALRLRQRIADPPLIESTRQALGLAEQCVAALPPQKAPEA